MAQILRVIAHEVLDGRGDALILHAANIAHRDPACKERILAKVLEVAAVQRRAIDIHAWSQQKRRAPRARIASQLLANL